MPTPFYLSIMKPVSFGPFGFMYIYEFINNILMHPTREVVLYKTN